MIKRLSVRLVVIYGMLMILCTAAIDIMLISDYQKKQFEKTEQYYKNIIETIYYMSNEYYEEELINMFRNTINGRILVLNKEGIVMMDSLKEYDGQTISNPEIRNTLKNDTESIGYYKIDHKSVMVLTAPIYMKKNQQKILLISTYVDKINDKIYDYTKQVVLLSAIITIFFVIISWRIGRKIARPIHEITIASKEISSGKLGVNVNIIRQDEIGTLAENFNKMSEELYKIDKNRKSFISSVSHELKTPLATMKVLIEALMLDENSEENKEYLQDINGEIDRLTKLVTSLLTATRIEEKKVKIEKINVKKMIDTSIKLCTPLAQDKKILMINHCDDLVIIRADQDSFQEIIINLLENSIKYGKDHGFVKFECYKKNDETFITIIDDGIGISQEDLPNIFDNFYRVEESRTRKKGGSGIGLYVVKKLVEMHKWNIDVESKLNEGSKFIIKI
ncbi:MAG: HAMP domain-containing histidine kinase [Marinisporobacter sp.]|jgi:signal transduction histidine kinase|nr:HAMP domain-containing histidine kinase [Marinisporobacter sp.]